MTLLFSRFGKRAALMALMAIFTVGNLLSAMAPDYYTLLASRLVTSLNHGAFFGLGAVVAASEVPMAGGLLAAAGLLLVWLGKAQKVTLETADGALSDSA